MTDTESDFAYADEGTPVPRFVLSLCPPTHTSYTLITMHIHPLHSQRSRMVVHSGRQSTRAGACGACATCA